MPLQDLKDIKALTFDVFGTTVDWRSSVESALRSALATKLPSSSSSSSSSPAPLLSQPLKEQVQKLLLTTQDTSNKNDWAATFAQEWRNAYKTFTRSFRAGQTPWKDIDAHHHDSLVELLARWGLRGLFHPAEIRELSLVWHRLAPWPDTAAGLRRLGDAGLVTATLSNGTRTLLSDLNSGSSSSSSSSSSNRAETTSGSEHTERKPQLGFARIISAEDFGAYKPDPKVYLGAAEKLGVAPGELAMVAAHLNDLEAARALGLRTVYVERPAEEDWDPSEERYQRAKDWVDLWVGLDPDQNREGGFVEVARRLEGVLAR